MNGLRSEALSPSHERERFSCGVAALDNYLQRQASQDMRRHVAAVFVMVREDQPRTILGYYTLASYAVETSGLPDETAKKLPRYPTTPAKLIGRLAVPWPDMGYDGRDRDVKLLQKPENQGQCISNERRQHATAD